MAPSYFPSYGSGEVPVGRGSGCCAAMGTAGAGGLGGPGGGAAGVWISTGPGFGTGTWIGWDIFGLGVFDATGGPAGVGFGAGLLADVRKGTAGAFPFPLDTGSVGTWLVLVVAGADTLGSVLVGKAGEAGRLTTFRSKAVVDCKSRSTCEVSSSDSSDSLDDSWVEASLETVKLTG